MHASRRRKKRSNYGVRCVELARGRQGFGFTISGQQPCILSCIVAGSPAERAGLRAGDYLVSANGQGVGRTPHDEVVRLIGSARGTLRLQIAESYYSDSSDDDGAAAAALSPSRPKPKGKPRPPSAQNRAAKVRARCLCLSVNGIWGTHFPFGTVDFISFCMGSRMSSKPLKRLVPRSHYRLDHI